MASSSSHTLLGMGNPLLDISTECGMDLLEKYDLKLNNAILAEPQHLPLYQELVEKYPVEYIAGGATQNSIRVAQWVSSTPGFAAYIGCIGHDEFGKQLKAAAHRDGVSTYYLELEDVPTGTCAVLVHDNERSLVANLSAASKYSKTHYDTPEIQEVVRGASIIYSAGFFLTSSTESMIAAGKLAAETGKIYAFNLSAPFLCQFFKEQMHSVLPYTDFVFGNESEAAAFAEHNGWGADMPVEEVALRIAALPKATGRRARIVIITQGSKQTIIAENGKITAIPVPAIPKSEIVDSNGAGDSFVGGFLALTAKGASIHEAVQAGHWAAAHVLRRSGCTFDPAARYPGHYE